MIHAFAGHQPDLAHGCFIANSAQVIGRVRLGQSVNIWYGCVLRGDVGAISVGARTNVQDLSVIHVTEGKHDTHIGEDVTVGHRVILHGCTLEHHILVGMGAVIMDGVTVGANSIVGAGSLLPPHKVYPANSLILGSPAKVVRPVTPAEVAHFTTSANRYVRLAEQHRDIV
jgi:carbonic anhydrase/acetyltransferase-like protein (isoleucine patch superfamily)